MNHFLYVVAAVGIGAAISLQPAINATMARTLGSPLLAATISIFISLMVVGLLWIVWGKASGDFSRVGELPWWVIIGGVLGVVFVAGSISIAPTLGIALFFVCVVAGQLFGSTLADHLGAFGVQVQPVSAMKLAGLGLVVAGAALVHHSGN